MSELLARRLRIFGTITTLVAVILFLGTRQREVGVYWIGDWFVCIGNGCFQSGFSSGRYWKVPGAPTSSGLYTLPAYHSDWTTAWRPFRARMQWAKGSPSYHFIVFPLWPLMPIGAAIAAYAHGMLVGMRRVRTTECQNCGYDLRKTPVVDGKRKCPECGQAAVIETAGGTPAPPDAK